MKNKSILGLKNISNKELGCLAATLNAELKEKEKVLMQIELIDDLLSISKLLDINASFSKSRNQKNRTYLGPLEMRIETELGI